MTTSIARPYHTLDHHHFIKNSGRKKCRCCPYGYHIDLDFVRYCETIASSQVLSDLPVRKTRWNVRKRRASKETLLGLADLSQKLENDSSKASQAVGDDLQKAVLDFEKVLSSTAVKSYAPPSKFREWLIPKDAEDHFKNYCTLSLPSTRKDISKKSEHLTQDDYLENVNSHGVNNASPQMLQSIRKQMATSLGRMRELEEEVKVIPNLQAHISNLEKENAKLNDLLAREFKKNRQTESVDASTTTSQLCHTRNIGIGYTVMARDIGVSCSARMVSSGCDPHIKLPSDSEKTTRPCLISLENIIGSSSKVPTKNVATLTERALKVTNDATTETELKFKKIFSEDDLNERTSVIKKEFETKTRKRTCTVGVMTDLKLNEVIAKKSNPMIDMGSQTSCKLETRNSSCQTVICTSEVGVSTRIHVTDSWVQVERTKKEPVLITVKKVDVGTQIIEKKKLNVTIEAYQQTKPPDLSKMKDQAVNTTKRKLVNTGVDACSLYCTKCVQLLSKSSPESSSRERPNRPSYLPVPAHSLSKSRIPRAINAEKLRNEDCGSDSGSDDGGYNPQNEEIVQRLGTLSTFHPIQSKFYKKEPSKEMKGALKVLNDALQKYSCENFPKHMRNAINIVQQEWFKVSSVADANPLDVEDYLDCFEEISGSLIEYIVNMTDVTGNTAMHYAVSNGNFDVVSILLDSKVCNINKLNTAGYTCIMLVALTKVKSETDRQVVKRLFQMADVNIRAKQHGQTALMLAVSHGRIDTVELLLESGADINIQDEDGSTALMCAAEHGYLDIVKLLLAQPDCDLTITDYDGSTALAIAMDAGNRDIGVLLYAQEHFSRGGSPFTPSKSHRRAKSATPTLRGGTPVQSPLGEGPQ